MKWGEVIAQVHAGRASVDDARVQFGSDSAATGSRSVTGAGKIIDRRTVFCVGPRFWFAVSSLDESLRQVPRS